MANSADPDQKPQNAASDQGLHCLLKYLTSSLRLNENVLRHFHFPRLHSDQRDLPYK